jgi:hypothetical protein|tara:strand:- start:666 stop:1169 length:504 start_codon:yes stop_codon:yes gene_type:complete
MSQQFRIQSEALRDQLNKLLPSQNNGAIGVELTGSTQIIPIIDLTETAEGSNVRADIQTAFSLVNSTFEFTTNTTRNLVATPGYYRLFGNTTLYTFSDCRFQITDGTTTKTLINFSGSNVSALYTPFDFVVFLTAGDTLQAVSTNTSGLIHSTTRQIADVTGNLVNP